ncbi:hypothetical protein [Hufsiella ginkgonis]|uniref:Type II secretion system protein GspC N-terminal domain-containing protein n=1 Tax=Hufsiella ginkgonis TaxID=2695274 RepID=A0A7K1XXU2_9SPHI|nr:hypothetical protein [Hufsiella ginkgonis]MXV15753.1 hypothetical protein [Hufsiella ginkgonis]
MKSKATTYWLIVVVIALWGMIIYRVISATGNEEAIPLRMAVKAKEPLRRYKIMDTVSLVLNYRDPFAGDKYRQEQVIVPAAPSSRQGPPPIQAPTMPAPQVRYLGYATSPETKKISAIIIMNNKEQMVSEGQTIDGLKLLKNLKDSLQVSYQGKTMFIKLN